MIGLLWFFGGVMLGLLVLAVNQLINWLMQPFNVAMMAASAIHHQREMDRAYRMQDNAMAATAANQAALDRLISRGGK